MTDTLSRTPMKVMTDTQPHNEVVLSWRVYRHQGGVCSRLNGIIDFCLDGWPDRDQESPFEPYWLVRGDFTVQQPWGSSRKAASLRLVDWKYPPSSRGSEMPGTCQPVCLVVWTEHRTQQSGHPMSNLYSAKTRNDHAESVMRS